MSIEIETILEIALQEFAKVFADASNNKGVSPEVEEVEELPSGNYLVTLGYWSRDSKPSSALDLGAGLFNPWRRKYKRVEIDPEKGKAVAIRMYEPALGVS
ncbi:MAG: hypothetical protein J0M04_17420 [Verrucomicrobia bacterium]|nr:hypothetical protein [Verrucomicrobiota bacterium]